VSPVKVIVRKWSRAQGLFMTATERFVDFEGAIRAGKTTPSRSGKSSTTALSTPASSACCARWTGDALDAQLKPKFYEECPRELLRKWNKPAKEEFQEFTNGSRVYIRSLKSSDDTARYAKFAGLTLAVIGVDQPEELTRRRVLRTEGPTVAAWVPAADAAHAEPARQRSLAG
jgi:hypothetical protein